jgi:oligo-1,6-glucosidase
MPGVTLEQAVEFTAPERREVDMVFQFEHVNLDQGGSKWDIRPFHLRELKATFGRWQAGLAEVGWNSLYWNNHDQPRVVSRYGDDGPYRVRSATMLGTGAAPAPRDAVRLPGRGTGHDERAVHQHRRLPRHRVDQPLQGGGRRRAGPGGGARRAAVHEPRQRPHADAVGRLRERRLHHGTPWLAVNPNHKDINAAAAVADPDSVFHHYRRLIESEAHRTRRRARRLHHAAAERRARVRVHPLPRRRGTAHAGQFHRRSRPVDLPGWGRREAADRQLPSDGNDGGIVLRPWEARVYRRTV